MLGQEIAVEGGAQRAAGVVPFEVGRLEDADRSPRLRPRRLTVLDPGTTQVGTTACSLLRDRGGRAQILDARIAHAGR